MGEMVYENRCKYRGCGTPLWQNGKGRKREYCDDTCRQAEHRARQADQAKEQARQQVASWGTFEADTIEYLAGFIVAGSPDSARKMAKMFQAEQRNGRNTHVQQEWQRMRELEEENKLLREQGASAKKKPMSQAERRELEQARADLLQLRKESAKSDEQIHILVESRKDLHMKLKIAEGRAQELKRQLDQADRGAANVQSTMRDYVTMTNEKLGVLSGKLARYRQEEEQGLLPHNLATIERLKEQLALAEQQIDELNQALTDEKRESNNWKVKYEWLGVRLLQGGLRVE